MPYTCTKSAPKCYITPETELKPGQAFFADIPLGDQSGYQKKIGIHPWLIINVDEECVEAVLCSTGDDPRRGKYNSDKEIALIASNRYDYMAGNYNLPPKYQHPPFSKNLSHTTIVQTENRHIIPLVELFKEKVQLNAEGQTLAQNELERIKKMTQDGQPYSFDPFAYLEDEDKDWSVEHYIEEENERNSKHAEFKQTSTEPTPCPSYTDTSDFCV